MCLNRPFLPPKKSLGQNFLIDKNIIEKILAVAEISHRDRVLEIGPGRGALTLPLYERTEMYVGVERDIDLALYLKEIEPDISLIVMDALRFCWKKMEEGRLINKIIGNLPYNIASRLIWDICGFSRGYDKMVFTVQKEVAQRICAKVGEKNYGPLGVWVHIFCETKIEFFISPKCFRPVPKVTSATISLFPRKDVMLSEEEKKKLAFVIKYCFRSPRKQMGNLLKSKWSFDIEKFFQKEGLNKKMRPGELTPEQYKKLTEAF